MATEATILFAVENLGNLLIKKVNFLRGVKKQAQGLKEELQNMKCFLKDAAEKQFGDQRIRKWISDIRELALDAEDAIEIFIHKVENIGPLKRCVFFPVHVSYIYKVGEEIESIRTRLHDINRMRQSYGIQNLGDGIDSSRIKRSENVERRRRWAYKQNDKHVVGLNEDVELLLHKAILDEKDGLRVAAIVGMGGSGKSTLARKIYNHDGIAKRFDCHAWVVVSSDFAAEDIIKQIMLQLKDISLDDKRLKILESMNDQLRRQEVLQEAVHEHLVGKQFFIVLDDVWEHTHLESLKSVFPDQKEKKSRLLLTSRNQIVQKHHGYIHKMRLLNPDDSWELFLKTAFLCIDGKCPQELESIGRGILKKCGGLPLAIVVAGGLLVNQGVSIWEKVLKQIKNSDSETNEISTYVSEILELSYHNLPPLLKACFLCLSFFKEDVIIEARMLIHIWVTLGFTSLEKFRGEETMEEIARGYLDELINRNLIQVIRTSTNYRVKYCYVHDLLRDLSIKKAKEEIGFEVGSSSTTPSHKSRHRVVQCSRESFMIGSPSQNKHIRSLFLLVDGKNVNLGTRSYWKSFELLRILDIEGIGLSRFPFCGLIGLRYLRIREVYEWKLPSWLEHLKNLEVLDLTGGEIELPNVPWKMDSLRHLYVNRLFGTPLKILVSTWKNLETLKHFESSDESYDVPPDMASCCLRKLSIRLPTFSSFIYCYHKSFGKMENLHITWTGYNIEDPMPLLGNLPKLLSLKLDGHHDNKILEMSVLRDGFPKLKFLSLEWMSHLRSIQIKEGAMPKLQLLSLINLPHLPFIEIEEGGMPQLQRLRIHNCKSLEIKDLPERIRSVAD